MPETESVRTRPGAGGREELLATCWSSAGDAAPDRADRRSPLPLRTRVEAAAAAGFTGFGLLSVDLPAAVAEYGLTGIATMLDDNGITTLELEDIPYWWGDDAHREESDRVRREVLSAAEALGARQVKVTPDGDNAAWERGQWAEAMSRLAQQASDVGCRLGLEFFPWANIGTLEQALTLVEQAGHPAAGVVIDVWHIARAGTPVESLRTVPVERIVGVELNDADEAVIGTLFEDTVHRRRFCGEGSFDLRSMVSNLRDAGWHGPWGVEILSDEYVTLPVATALERAANSARRVLGAVG